MKIPTPQSGPSLFSILLIVIIILIEWNRSKDQE
jgi:hypothetical protein